MSNDDMTVYIKIDGEWRNCHSVIKSQAAEIERLKNSLQEIAELAHDKSTGPAVPDVCWEIRRMAYDAI